MSDQFAHRRLENKWDLKKKLELIKKRKKEKRSAKTKKMGENLEKMLGTRSNKIVRDAEGTAENKRQKKHKTDAPTHHVDFYQRAQPLLSSALPTLFGKKTEGWWRESEGP